MQKQPISQERLRQLQKKLLWVPQKGPQLSAFLSPADIILYGGAAGGGKLMRLSDVVMSPKGFKKMYDLEVGDLITDPITGGSTKVIGIYPQGKKQIIRFTFDDGAVLDTGYEHLWRYRPNAHQRIRPGSKSSSERDFAISELGADPYIGKPRGWKTGNTRELMQLLDNGIGVRIPLTAPVIFTKNWKAWKHDPYFVGLFLGDGYIKGFQITNIDPEIIDYCVEHGFRFDGKKTLRLPNENLVDGKKVKNTLKVSLQNYFYKHSMVNCTSADKFIPDSLKLSPLSVRLALLQGLMDTDGTVDDRGRCYYCTISKRLAEDVQFIARSLGGKARIRERITQYTYNGEKRSGQKSYNIRIWLPKNSVMFRVKRKRDRCTDSWNGGYELSRELVGYEVLDVDDAACIRVDSPDSLYLGGKDLVVTHNTALAMGLALTRHSRTLFMRRESKQLGAVIDEIAGIVGTRKGYNGQEGVWRFNNLCGRSRQITFGSCPHLGDEERFQGRARDLLILDEAAHFLELQARFLMGWVRTTDPTQRTRILMCSNPPRDAQGDWLIRMFAPWLDAQHGNPAKPGEIRHFSTIEGKDFETGPEPFLHKGELITPQSRTFIPARITDNKYLVETGYMAQLQSLPEPLRSQMLYGDFLAGRDDDEWQIIPTDWVRQANDRWEERQVDMARLSSVGVDPSRGGRDKTVVSRRCGWWFAPLVSFEGEETKKGGQVAAKVIELAGTSLCPVHVDIIGIGASVIDHLEAQIGDRAIHLDSRHKSEETDFTGNLGFTNKRSEMWWKFRDMLNPDNGFNVALPPDSQLKADLTAPTYKLTPRGVQVEQKEDVKKRLGRSPDRADAVIYCAERTPLMFNNNTPGVQVRSSFG